jgi:antitoxin (DNA-binding transcriptional repressor) of toxin-antitoxin stability system
MMTVGVRELKENLSRYLKRIKEGEGLIVTERKRQVAILLPFETEGSEKEKVLRLVRQGMVRWSGERPKGLKRRVPVAGKKMSEIVLEDRR